ncbi:hypothetical protein JVT61DRAFT_7067 [Boletus reticuloceps]|uniref:DUF6830 domain-containing protein n=1 Tax=Boletus reticuloceps TaxID=495285 RepID=A0A8I2YIK8_9AGAM|nr:hypothetical protein JVT61DRAFT_7067 [Boletus reticuloceps]
MDLYPCYSLTPSNNRLQSSTGLHEFVAFHRAQPTSACNTNPPPQRTIIHVPQQNDGVDMAAAGMDPKPMEDPKCSCDSEDPPIGAAEWFVENVDEDMATQWDVAMDRTVNSDEVSPPSSPPVDAELEPIFPAIRTLCSATGWAVDLYPNAGQAMGNGQSFLAKFRQDEFAPHRESNLYYPFSGPEDWKVANFLLTSRLSMRAIDDFLSLKLVKTLPLSFASAKELRSRAEILPSGPVWKFQIVPTTHPTKQPIHLYYRDSLDCIEALFNNPLFAGHMDFSPYRLFTTAEQVVRLYTEWMSSDGAWELQSQIPQDSTLCGVILSSDKTNITNMCGGKVAHPLLISLANIRMKVRNKASSHAFLLLALIPIPRFLHHSTRICSVLEARLFHQCLDIVLEPLKTAARIGRMMSDPAGNLRYCFTPLVSYIVDLPEAAMVACVRGLTSPVTLAKYDLFGDSEPCQTRTGAHTLAQLQSLQTDPADVEGYFNECEQYRLSGVSHPFFRDWALSCPARFLTPECLHYWHRFFWDHDLRWCKQALGACELDFRFSVLPPTVGLGHFNQGVTQLKQITGRVQRDAQRYIVVVLSGFPDASVVTAIRALMDFHYLAQAPVISSVTRDKIVAALTEFHQHKQAILDHNLRRGPQTNAPLEHFHIPKLELMHNVAPSIKNVGSILQWTADTTEHAHIEVVKDPASMTNNKDYDAQICRTLDRNEKCRLFNTATTTSLSEQSRPVDNGDPDAEDEIDDGRNDDHENLAEELWSESPHRKATNLFAVAQRLLEAIPGTIPKPLRVFIAGSTAFHLNHHPSIRCISIDDAALKFALPDLRGALGDYLNREGNFTRNFHVFGTPRRSPKDVPLPFNDLRIWYKVRLQQKSYYDMSVLGSTFTVHAHPPDQTWRYGRYDGALLNIDEVQAWPSSGLAGHSVILVRMIMCPAPPKNQICPWADRFLIYAERLDIVTVEPATGLHVLKRATRASGAPLGEIFPLDQLQSYCHLAPRFDSAQADNRLNHYNSIHSSSSMYLNKYIDKEMYYAVTGL